MSTIHQTVSARKKKLQGIEKFPKNTLHILLLMVLIIYYTGNKIRILKTSLNLNLEFVLKLKN